MLKNMEIQLTKDVQARLDQLSSETGRTPDEIVQDAMAGYFDELTEVRGTLDRRYDDVVNGRVKLVPGAAVVARFREKSATARQRQMA